MTDDNAPSLQAQTMELGKTLKAIADAHPNETPGETARAVFAAWMQEAGPNSREPGYFADVLSNFDLMQNTNKDVWEMFDLLENYIEVDDDDDAPIPAPRTFIGLPLVGDAPQSSPE